MTKRLLTATGIGLVLAVSSVGIHTAMAKANDSAVVVAERADNFRLVDADGRAHELYRLKDASAVVFATTALGAADMKKFAPEIEALKAAYADKGVEFLMLNATGKDDRDAVAAEAQELGLTIPVLMDDMQLVGGHLGVTKTSEVFVVNPKTWEVVYHGALNRTLAEGKKPKGKTYAADAIDAVIAGEPVAVETVAAKGTTIAFPDRTPSAKAAHAEISYTNEIAPILEAKCVSCHQEGSIAPFAMDRYEVVKGFAPMIREAVRTDRMPPWDADAHVGTFKDDASLTEEQTRTLINWIEAGAPRGEGEDPLAAEKHVAPEWPLGEPDMIVEIPTYTIPAAGVVDYQYPIVENPLTEGKWVKASTAKVSQRQAVHHILSGLLPKGKTFEDSMEALGGTVGGYTVGMESVVQPDDIGVYIPADQDFGYQMHYTPFGKEVVSAEKIGLYFYDEDELPTLRMRETALVDQFIKIPPRDGNHKEVAYFNFPHDAILHTAVVHAHYRGTYSKLELQTPDGKRETILNVPFYDFNWQRMYEFEEPLDIPAGSKLIATYIYDNSARNPANPDPDKEVTWGDQSFEEMFYTSLRYRWKDETVANPVNYTEEMLSTRLIGMMDDNIDDKVQVEELRGPFARLAPQFALGDTNKDGGIDAEEFVPIMKMLQNGSRRRGSEDGDAASK